MLASHQDLSSRAIRDFQRPLGGLKRRLLWLVSSVPEAFCPYRLPLKHLFMTFSRDAGRSPVLQESGSRVPLGGQFISSDTPQGSRNHLSPRAGSSFWFGLPVTEVGSQELWHEAPEVGLRVGGFLGIWRGCGHSFLMPRGRTYTKAWVCEPGKSSFLVRWAFALVHVT